jgi:hypothetical protein
MIVTKRYVVLTICLVLVGILATHGIKALARYAGDDSVRPNGMSRLEQVALMKECVDDAALVTNYFVWSSPKNPSTDTVTRCFFEYRTRNR